MGAGIGDHTQFCQAPEHHERVVRTSAQALSASQLVHQVWVSRRASLHGAPRKVVENLVVTARGSLEGLLSAISPIGAANGLR
jgi:hypothetical protein